MTQSYSNQDGSGDRFHRLRSYTSAGFMSGPGGSEFMLRGNPTGNNTDWTTAAVSGTWIAWDFRSSRVITELKFYQSNTVSHGVWQFQGSADGSSWTSIGSTFTLGGVATQTITTMSANTTGYRYYRLLGVSGTKSNNPFTREWEFEIDEPAQGDIDVSYYNTGAVGARTGIITATHSFGGSWAKIVDGGLNNNGVDAVFWAGASGQAVTFDFGTPKVLRGARYFQQNTTNQGTFKWQGSPDNSTWTDIGGTFTLGPAVGDQEQGPFQELDTLASNETAYRYWKMISTAGTQSDGPWVPEMMFAVGDTFTPPAPPANTRKPVSVVQFF